MKKLYQLENSIEEQKWAISSDKNTVMQVIYFTWRKMKNNDNFYRQIKNQIKEGEYCRSVKTVKSVVVNKTENDIVI